MFSTMNMYNFNSFAPALIDAWHTGHSAFRSSKNCLSSFLSASCSSLFRTLSGLSSGIAPMLSSTVADYSSLGISDNCWGGCTSTRVFSTGNIVAHALVCHVQQHPGPSRVSHWIKCYAWSYMLLMYCPYPQYFYIISECYSTFFFPIRLDTSKSYLALMLLSIAMVNCKFNWDTT
jgi:hypothetical protein